MNFFKKTLIIYLMLLWIVPAHASEVIQEMTPVKVLVREHPKTGKPYVSIVPAKETDIPDPFARLRSKYPRPDYRLLDPQMKRGQIPYEGPYSDRKKVYVLAASLAAVGVVGGLGIIAAAPAATGAGASGGAGAYLAGGSAVTAGTVAGSYFATRPDPKKDDFTHESKTRLMETSGKENFFSSKESKI